MRIFTAKPYWVALLILGMSGQWFFGNFTAKAADVAKPTEPNAQTPLCRFGVNDPAQSNAPITSFDTAALRIGWYIDYQASPAPLRPNGIKYTPLIRLQQTGSDSYAYSPSGATLQQAIAGNLGTDWFIGNEPDRMSYQDDMTPALYARAYHELYHLIKTADPTAHIFAGSIVQPTPLRLQYLDKVLSSYVQQFGEALPVDGWAIHNFILNEASCNHYKDSSICWGADIPPTIAAIDGLRIELKDNDNFELFKQQIVRFRQWLAQRGYAGKPVYLSEYGVLMPNIFSPPADFPPSRVNAFMNKTFDYLLNITDPILGDPDDNYRLIQRFSWYSTSDNVNFNGYLFERASTTAPFQLSPMGRNYANYTAALTATTDLAVTQVMVNPPAPLMNSGEVTFTLKARIANSGQTGVPQSAVVRFFDKDPKSGGVQIGKDQTVTLVGCGDSAEVSTQWPRIAPANYQIYISVDPDNTLTEVNKKNNIKSQSVFFATSQLFLPIISNRLIIQ